MVYVAFITLGVILFYTREDWAVKPRTPLEWYLLFTVIFYFYRWTFQLGPPETTIYEGDAPWWVRSIKDAVFLAVVARCAYKGKFRYSALLWYLSPFVVWTTIAAFISLLVVVDTKDVLFHLHTSLEYIPLAFLAVEERLGEFLKFAVGCCWIVVAFLFLEIFSGRASGFFKEAAFFSRYGSIFGSPNELGAFIALALIGCLVFAEFIPRRTKVFLLPALSLALVLSGSRSAVLGFVAGLAAIWPRSKKWLFVIAGASVVLYLCLFTVFSDASLVDDMIARVGDASAASRLDQFGDMKGAVNDWGVAGIIFGSWRKIDQENYYFSVLVRSGLLGLILLSTFAVITVWRARHPFLRAGVVSVLVAACFVPYLDIFPISAYFWLMVGAVWSFSKAGASLKQAAPNSPALLPGAPRVAV